ncbi:peptidylprolyl isomerase [Novosphingobium sp.]|uniref:peptidylprolyl isomerase n=1 Tax=Novosphingobium sp. TaxID=1874826 RepID=UPI0025D8AE8E|nr:peptidylprolyl isomerase [Novosphingobium sp.]
MNRRFALAAALCALALSIAPAQAAKPRKAVVKTKPAPPPAPLPDTVRVAMVTALGTIEVDLDHRRAPITVENFVRYVDAKKFDGMPFYRAMRLNWGTQPNGLIQAGLQANPLKVFKPIAHEPTSQTGILHKAGTISMARYAPGTAMADFSILLSDLPSLDADPKSANAESQAGFAAFGHVVTGMDVVRKIWDAPLSPTKGEGPLKGQMLEPPVKVLTVRRVSIPAP